MYLTITDDPVADFERYDHELHKHDYLYPDCEHCGEPIVAGDEYVEIDDKIMHYECAENWLMKQRREMPERWV